MPQLTIVDICVCVYVQYILCQLQRGAEFAASTAVVSLVVPLVVGSALERGESRCPAGGAFARARARSGAGLAERRPAELPQVHLQDEARARSNPAARPLRVGRGEHCTPARHHSMLCPSLNAAVSAAAAAASKVTLRRSWHDIDRVPRSVLRNYRLSLSRPDWLSSLPLMVDAGATDPPLKDLLKQVAIFSSSSSLFVLLTQFTP